MFTGNTIIKCKDSRFKLYSSFLREDLNLFYHPHVKKHELKNTDEVNQVLLCESSATFIVTSKAGDLDGVERPSLQPRVARVDRALPFAQTAGELELVRGEDVADQVAQQPPAVLLGGVDGFVPLLVGDEERIVLQELLAALRSGDSGHMVLDHEVTLVNGSQNLKRDRTDLEHGLALFLLQERRMSFNYNITPTGC